MKWMNFWKNLIRKLHQRSSSNWRVLMIEEFFKLIPKGSDSYYVDEF